MRVDSSWQWILIGPPPLFQPNWEPMPSWVCPWLPVRPVLPRRASPSTSTSLTSPGTRRSSCPYPPSTSSTAAATPATNWPCRSSCCCQLVREMRTKNLIVLLWLFSAKLWHFQRVSNRYHLTWSRQHFHAITRTPDTPTWRSDFCIFSYVIIHVRVISEWVPKLLFCIMILIIIFLKVLSQPPGANELMVAFSCPQVRPASPRPCVWALRSTIISRPSSSPNMDRMVSGIT